MALFNSIVYSLDDGFVERACWIFLLLLVEVNIIKINVKFYKAQNKSKSIPFSTSFGKSSNSVSNENGFSATGYKKNDF